MKKLLIFLALLISLQGFGQTVLRSGTTVLRVYDSQQPLNIETTCEVWLDGKDDGSFTLDGTSVDQWDDKSGNDRHVLNGNANATRPTYDINTGRVTFVAANSTFLQSAAFASALSQPNTIFIVYKITGDISDTEYVITSLTHSHLLYYSSSIFKIYAGATDLENGATNANDNIHCALFKEILSEFWINGVLGASGGANIGNNNLEGITLGMHYPGSQYADVSIMEVIIYNADISDVDRDKITGYLAWKWDITATTDFKGYVLRSWQAESNEIFAAMGTDPPYARKVLIDNLVKGLKDDGVWTLLDFFYILAAHAENSSLLNWINPGTFDATNVSSTAFEIDRGYTGAAGDYLNSNYNPNTDGINYALDDASAGVYCRTTAAASTACELGVYDGASFTHIYIHFLAGISRIRMNGTTARTGANVDAKGFFILNRVLSTHQDLYKNKVRIINGIIASTTVPNESMYLLALNNNGSSNNWSTKQIAAAFAGGGMTQTNIDNFTDRIETYLDALGAGVISEMMWLILLLIPNIRRKEEEFKIAA